MTASVPRPAITPPAMLGILGGGPFGRYSVMAARSMGYRTTVLDPDPHAPAGTVADVHLVAPYDDAAALRQLADTCAVVTTEFETAPVEALRAVTERTLVRPSPDALAVCQDRIAERSFLSELGVPLAPWRAIVTEIDVEAAVGADFPAILKTARPVAEGNGQMAVVNHAALASAWESLGRVPCVLERRMRVFKDLSIVIARTPDGSTSCYPVAQNLHIKGVLDSTYVPASLPAGGQQGAEDLAAYIADELDVVGVLTIEMFVVARSVYVNELAPRPHNTGHFTLDACVTSQFEQQIRAVCGLGLGSNAMSAPGAAMVNLLGDVWADGEPDWSQVLAEPSAHLHL
ncbi:MAG: 5-(carboxyamino)imidazole ribonucleotide synthase [Ilumatobacteraceae bacterium]